MISVTFRDAIGREVKPGDWCLIPHYNTIRVALYKGTTLRGSRSFIYAYSSIESYWPTHVNFSPKARRSNTILDVYYIDNFLNYLPQDIIIEDYIETCMQSYRKFKGRQE